MGNLERLDTTSISLVDSSPARILADIRASLSQALGYDVDDADPWMVVAASLMPYFVQSRALADVAAKASNLAFAAGDSLDALAAGYGLERRTDRKAVVYVYICMGDWGDVVAQGDAGALTIGRLSLVKKDESDNVTARFEYGIGSVRFEEGAGWIQIPLYCTETGPDYNGITDFELEAFEYVYKRDDAAQSTAWFSVSITYNPNDMYEKITSFGGAEAETDNEFAARVFNELAAANAAGSIAYYKAAVMREPGIIDARVLSADAALAALRELFGQGVPDDQFAGYDVIVVPLAEESLRGWGDFIGTHIQVSFNASLFQRLQASLNDIAIVGSNIMIFPAYGILQMFCDVYKIRYYIYQTDANETGIDEMRTRIETAFNEYLHWQCDSMLQPFSIGELVKRLIVAGAAKVNLYDVNDMPVTWDDDMYTSMIPLLFAARKFERYDSSTQQNVIVDSLVLEYAGTVEKIAGYL